MIPTVSVVVPIYKSEQTIQELCERVLATLKAKKLNGQIILVNDGSPDQSWSLIRKLSSTNKSVIGLNLARNFGQHNAILAGLNAASGDWVVVMDADLQDHPEAIGDLFDKATSEGFDAAIAKRVGQANGAVNALTSKLFYRVLKSASGIDGGADEGNFGIYSKRLIDTVKSVADQDFFFPAVVRWAGFKSTSIEVSRSEREFGESSYTFRRRLNLALRVLVVNSNKLLRLSISVGLITSTIALIYAIYLVIANLLGDIQVAGWTSVMVAIFFMGGAVLVSNGVLGLYLGKIFDSTKGRPRYIVAEQINQ
jgi:dolichol-phosphate mannosyltransferase